MLLIVIVCLANFLELPVVQSEKEEHCDDHTNCTPEKKAYLPGHLIELPHVKNKRSVQMSQGRQVDIPDSVIKSMENVPLSALSPSLPDIRKMIVDSHNEYRCKVSPSASNMLKVVWNDEATKTAGNWAKQCKVGHSPQTMRKITNYNCGENIFLSNFKVPWSTVIAAWYSEVVDFDYGVGAKKAGIEVGHYTQLTWATSYATGCDVAECDNNPNFKYSFVCHMCPAGNKGNLLYPYKSGSPCADCPTSCENDLCTNPCPYQDYFKDCLSYKTGDTCGNDESLKTDCPAMCLCNSGQIK